VPAWDRALGDVITAVITADDDLVVGTRAGSVARISADGSIRWRHDLGSAVITVTGCDGSIAVAAPDRVVWLGPDGAPIRDLGWPAGPIELAELRTGGIGGLYLRDAAGRHSWLGPAD
jgi:hypothetical protein